MRLLDFQGEWRLERRISEAAGEARFDGAAVFSPCDKGLAYHEQGCLTLPNGAQMQGERRYLWREEGARIAVDFEDRRFFHHVPEGGGAAAHWCPPDQYDGVYDFTEWPVGWSVTWVVKGPRKDYRMMTRYRRG